MDIGDLLGSLSGDDIKNLQDIASSLFGGETKNNDKKGSSATDIFSGIDLNAFSSIASIMSGLQGGEDPRCKLLLSLKPLLSPQRAKRVDEAVKIMKMIELIPLLRDSGLLKGVL